MWLSLLYSSSSQGFKRGSYAHKNLHQFFIALSGEFDLKVNDGSSEKLSIWITPLKVSICHLWFGEN